jgi:5-hydroxyisourate hydrolase
MASTGRLTTHVLDTAHGHPAVGMAIELLKHDGDGGTVHRLGTARTNEDGRTDAPLLAEGALEVGRYELIFDVGAYFAAQGVSLPEPPFIDRVSLRIGVADPNAHHHVPLLVAPWFYATYRGG